MSLARVQSVFREIRCTRKSIYEYHIYYDLGFAIFFLGGTHAAAVDQLTFMETVKLVVVGYVCAAHA